MNKKHQKVLNEIFKDPISSKVKWDDIESLFINLGADISEGRGSRVRIELNYAKAVFHRPHPERETDKGALKSVRRFLLEAGIGNEI
jgi:hypothetical protein